ncbi:gp16 family protein [Martelella mediterranea]|uniref:Phage gp16-like protein n=1 Tax=Martelella mediterranea TaxID=293089 RepID=A0A4R3NU95_9HYPH|nr:regulatory protein GemA [Martelella mediterranea]TCT41175.1 phage gp16-like protein [Martelella mediterranea]
MSRSIAALHVAKKQLGLDDETYRAKLSTITGKSSAKEMSEAERQKVLTVFRNEGFSPKATEARPDGRKKLTGKFAPKLQALWIAAWNLGLVNNRDDAALLAFVKRQTGIDHTRFLTYGGDASKAIEALKSWIKREGGVSYGNSQGEEWLQSDIAKVCWAQWRLLEPEAQLYPDTKGFPAEVLKIAGIAQLTTPLGILKPADWRLVSNELGKRIRARKASA